MKKMICIALLGFALQVAYGAGAQVPKSDFPCGGKDPDSNCNPLKVPKRNKGVRRIKALHVLALQNKTNKLAGK